MRCWTPFLQQSNSLIENKEEKYPLVVRNIYHLPTKGKNGVFMGGTINFGFKNVDKEWTIEPEESKWVKQIFKMFNEGKSLKQIKTYLDTNNVKPRRNKLWSLGTLLTILKNKVYIGEYHWKDNDSGRISDSCPTDYFSFSI